MKNLCLTLDSHLPPLLSQEKLPLPALLDRSLGYVKHLKERVERLQARKDGLKEDMAMAAVQVNERDSTLEVNLVTRLNKGLILSKVLSILEGEGAQVLSANYSRLSDRILYTVTCQAFSPRIGIDTSRVRDRLKILAGASFVSPPLPAENSC